MRANNPDRADDAAQPPTGRFRIGFDDIDLGFDRFEPLPGGYQGLRWLHFNAYAGTSATAGSGYETGLTSGSQAAFNVSALPAQVALAGGTFTLKSVNLTAAWNSAQTVDIYGYRHGEEVYHVTVSLDDLGPTKVLLDFQDVRRVRFVPGEGTDDPALDGQGEHIVFDDFVFSNVHVREPASLPAAFGSDLLLPVGHAHTAFTPLLETHILA